MESKKKKVLFIVIFLLLVALLIFLLLRKDTKYTVKFDLGNDNITSVETTGKVTKPKDPEKEGYIFDGLYLDNEKFDFDKEISANTTLTARWRKVGEVKEGEVLVQFDSNGGTTVKEVILKKDEKLTRPVDPTRYGFTFLYWTLNGKEFDFDSKVSESIKLIANWKENSGTSQTNKYSVTFNTDGGSAVSPVEVISGSKVSKPADPTVTDYKNPKTSVIEDNR